VINYCTAHYLLSLYVCQFGQSGFPVTRQTARQLIIFWYKYAPAVLFWAYSYSGPSDFGHFGQIFWRIIHTYAR